MILTNTGIPFGTNSLAHSKQVQGPSQREGGGYYYSRMLQKIESQYVVGLLDGSCFIECCSA